MAGRAKKGKARAKKAAQGAAPPRRVGRRGRREWKGAQTSLLTGSWLTWQRPIDHDIYNGLRALVARSRNEAQNNDHVKHFLRICKTNIVGAPGIRLQMRAKLANGNPDRRVNDAIESAWRDWGRFGSPDVTGRLSWNLLCQQAVETLARDGEALFRRVRGWDRNAYGYALQAIDPQALDVSYNDTGANGNRIVMGVELDSWRRPVAYHLLSESHPLLGGDVSGARGRRARDRLRLPAEDVLHLFLPEWVWQTRGVPWTATALLRMFMLAGYEDAEIVAARAAASKMGFLQVGDDASTEDYQADAETEDGALVDQFEPGQVEILPKGYTFEGWDPQHPNAAYAEFVKACLRGIASGLGVNYNTLANDLQGVNYTSLRHGMLTERDMWMLLQGFVAEAFCQTAFDDWLSVALLKGAITASGRPLPPEKVTQYRVGASWQPRRWAWVDPEKDINAARSEYGLRTRSISDIIRARGEDPDEVWGEIARDHQRLAELGIPMPSDSGGAGASSVPPAGGPTQDDPASDTGDTAA